MMEPVKRQNVQLLGEGTPEQEDDLVKRQRQILHDFNNQKQAYKQKRLAVDHAGQQNVEVAERTWQITQNEANKTLEKAHRLFQEANNLVSKYQWSSILVRTLSDSIPVDDDEEKDIDAYYKVAEVSHSNIQAFFHQYGLYSTNLKFKTRWKWRAFWTALTTLIVVWITTHSGGYGIIAGIIFYFVVYILGRWYEESILKDNFRNLAASVSGIEVLAKEMLRPHKADYQKSLDAAEARYKGSLLAVDREWAKQQENIRKSFLNFNLHAKENFLGTAWSDTSWVKWKPPATIASCSRLGTFTTSKELPSIPALISCPGAENILFMAHDKGKEQAVNAIQSLMLRLLATQPPGKVQFTLIDPVGLGQNVSTFMQLTEHYEELVGGKVWSEAKHIEQALADTSEHISNVIQKYLRGQYATIDEYNRQAGEVAEPYRIIVVIGFPVKFSRETATRLVEIAANGPKCGVSTVVMTDVEQSLPYDFNIEDLKRVSTVLTWNDERFVWQDSDYEKLHFITDRPPSLDLFNRLLHEVGKEAKTASKVEVPFARTALPESEWWKSDSRSDISASLGRAGATRLQSLVFGKGTAHHALVIGRIGSGKTTLLHVLIINLALAYSPDELEFYLVDFKNVGFTAYAHKLPHARVVAIQSEPELGLSVLQGLDNVLKHREQLLSKAGVQEIAQYRDENPTARLPRIVLIIDEFQELFAQSDRIAQEANQILDRLIRLGRGFGMHVILSSQTLAGSYVDFNKSIVGQMGVRIALQCSEADSHLILANDNPAARLLFKPGEAIYNASNGLVEGNNRFQCFWLPDEELKRYVSRIQRFSQESEQRKHLPPWRQIVFDGHTNARIERNITLEGLISDPHWSVPQKAVGWLGDPLSIQEGSTVIEFENTARNNVMILGQQEEMALGIFLSTLLSLSVQYAPSSARIIIADFSAADSPYAGIQEKISNAMPNTIEVVGRHEFLPILTQITNVVSERLENFQREAMPIYIFIFGLQWARDLRAEDESYPLSHKADQPSPSKLFSDVLREGPELGIHTLIWCNTLDNVNRSLKRGLLQEFNIRIACHISQAESQSFIDSPIASKLVDFGHNRAVLFNIGNGTTNKFLPYGIPGESWWRDVTSKLQRKT